MAALEAMSSGLPVVATNTGGLGHLVPDQGGLKVTQGSHQALAAALIRLLEDPNLRRQCGNYNRTLVVREYAWPQVVERLEGIYASVLRLAAAA